MKIIHVLADGRRVDDITGMVIRGCPEFYEVYAKIVKRLNREAAEKKAAEEDKPKEEEKQAV